ncbi:MAG TPA: transcriptional regulator [Candidatus Saccharimonadales bacterium]
MLEINRELAQPLMQVERAGNHVEQEIRKAILSQGISSVIGWTILDFLNQQEAKKASLREIRESIRTSKANLTEVLQTLARVDYVYIAKSPLDGRERIVSMTVPGKETFDASVPTFNDAIATLLKPLESSELAQLGALTAKILNIQPDNQGVSMNGHLA